MVEQGHPRLSASTQCQLLSIPRSTVCQRAAGETSENLALMQITDRRSWRRRSLVGRQMSSHLRNAEHSVTPKRVRRLMHLMPIYPTPTTSKLVTGRQPCPCWLGRLTIDKPSEV